MATHNQIFEGYTDFIATRGVREYRETIPVWVNAEDIVLEIGCEWGTTTTLIAPHCKKVIGTDISPKCIDRARETHPELHFEVLDGFDVRAALELGKMVECRGTFNPFNKIYLDISGLSGYNSLLDTIALLTSYATVLRPEAIIVKSGALKRFAGHCNAWRSSDNQ